MPRSDTGGELQGLENQHVLELEDDDLELTRERTLMASAGKA